MMRIRGYSRGVCIIALLLCLLLAFAAKPAMIVPVGTPVQDGYDYFAPSSGIMVMVPLSLPVLALAHHSASPLLN